MIELKKFISKKLAKSVKVLKFPVVFFYFCKFPKIMIELKKFISNKLAKLAKILNFPVFFFIFANHFQK